LNPTNEKELTKVLLRNKYLYTWTSANMSGIHPWVMSYKLAIFRKVRLVAQKKSRLREEWRKVAKNEVQKLLEVDFIREVKYTSCPAHVVLVKKLSV